MCIGENFPPFRVEDERAPGGGALGSHLPRLRIIWYGLDDKDCSKPQLNLLSWVTLHKI
jgi:hypothetical protein